MGGKDIFVFNTKPNKSANLDKIADFSVRNDSIWLDNSVFKKLGKGSEANPVKLNKSFFTVGSGAKDKNDYVIYNSKKGVLLYDADGSGAGAAVQVTTLSKYSQRHTPTFCRVVSTRITIQQHAGPSCVLLVLPS